MNDYLQSFCKFFSPSSALPHSCIHQKVRSISFPAGILLLYFAFILIWSLGLVLCAGFGLTFMGQAQLLNSVNISHNENVILILNLNTLGGVVDFLNVLLMAFDDNEWQFYFLFVIRTQGLILLHQQRNLLMLFL